MLTLYIHIYILTATGLTAGGSSTVHIYTQTITQNNTVNLGRVRAVSIFACYTLSFALQLREKSTGKPRAKYCDNELTFGF